MDIGEAALQAHKKLRGKISVELKDKLDSRQKLSIYYTPDVAELLDNRLVPAIAKVII